MRDEEKGEDGRDGIEGIDGSEDKVGMMSCVGECWRDVLDLGCSCGCCGRCCNRSCERPPKCKGIWAGWSAWGGSGLCESIGAEVEASDGVKAPAPTARGLS